MTYIVNGPRELAAPLARAERLRKKKWNATHGSNRSNRGFFANEPTLCVSKQSEQGKQGEQGKRSRQGKEEKVGRHAWQQQAIRGFFAHELTPCVSKQSRQSGQCMQGKRSQRSKQASRVSGARKESRASKLR